MSELQIQRVVFLSFYTDSFFQTLVKIRIPRTPHVKIQKNRDNDEEEDELLHDLTQEFEFREESGPPIHKKN